MDRDRLMAKKISEADAVASLQDEDWFPIWRSGMGMARVSGAAVKHAACKPTPTLPARFLNSAGFQISATKHVLVSYSVKIVCTATIGSAQDGKVELLSDAGATPTAIRATAQHSCAATLAAALQLVSGQTVQLSYLVPAGHYVRLITSQTAGSPVFELVSTVESVLG